MSNPPVIFISYSHDSVRHRERVRRLAERLRVEAGCDVRIDVAAEPTVAQWPRWMRRQIEEADTVLMVFTKVYRQRFDGEEKPGLGRGVMWESTIIENTIYAAAGPAALKFVPMVFEARDSDHVPREVFSGTVYEIPGGWERLLACLRARVPQARRVVQAVDAAVGVVAAIGASVRRAHRLAFDLQLAKIEGETRYRREVEDILETRFAAQKHLPRLVARRGVDLNRVFLAGPLAQ